jgi:predicted porin
MKQNKGLGSVPKGLAWLEQDATQEEMIEQVKEVTQVNSPVMKSEMPMVKTSQKGLHQGWSRATFILQEDLIDKLKAIAYWERMTIKDVLQDALAEYFKDRDIQAIPKRKPKY